MGLILKSQFVDFGVGSVRHKTGKFGAYTVFFANETGVAEAVVALIVVEIGLSGLPAGIPNGVSIFDIVIAATCVDWHVVVAVAGETPELGIFVEAVAASRVGDETEELLVAEIVNPRVRGLRVSDYIFPVGVIKISVFHILFPSLWQLV
jgi:hypothetical protein